MASKRRLFDAFIIYKDKILGDISDFYQHTINYNNI